ncbi:hypothetical protein J6590_039919 [Homalodisca vitripennis]|nr:hypothetical protein J6590_039919 [Homalodisca vitripennis]
MDRQCSGYGGYPNITESSNVERGFCLYGWPLSDPVLARSPPTRRGIGGSLKKRCILASDSNSSCEKSLKFYCKIYLRISVDIDDKQPGQQRQRLPRHLAAPGYSIQNYELVI